MTAHLFRLKIGANFFKNGNRIFDNWKVLSEICKNFFFCVEAKGGGEGVRHEGDGPTVATKDVIFRKKEEKFAKNLEDVILQSHILTDSSAADFFK